MIFNSLEYIIFLPIVFIIYWCIADKVCIRNAFIVIASYLFYGWWDYRFLALFFLTTLSSYTSGMLMHSYNRYSKSICCLNIAINLGILFLFKYFNFFAENLAILFGNLGISVDWVTTDILLPVGVSFYTFQAIGYSIEVYRKNIEPTKDALAFWAFISFFPQLVAGPIERAGNLLPQFCRKISFPKDAGDGMRQILWGFFKKMVIADNCAVFVDSVWYRYEYVNGYVLLFAAILFAFQIYGDFSGYSDIAIGTGKLFGINLSTNFRTPYFAIGMADFWRRWHISLMNWFRDYVYIPLGGNRISKSITIRNIFIVFLLSGLWHGANWTFVLWGTYHACLLVMWSLFFKNRTWSGMSAKMLMSVVTFCCATIGWVIFRCDDVAQVFGIFSKIFSTSVFEFVRINKEHYFAYIILMLIVEWIYRKEPYTFAIKGNGLMRYAVCRWGVYFLLVMAIIVLSGPNVSFIYFQF